MADEIEKRDPAAADRVAKSHLSAEVGEKRIWKKPVLKMLPMEEDGLDGKVAITYEINGFQGTAS